MMRASRMTARAAASISFGMGSFILMADLTASVLRHGDEGGTVFDMGFPSLLGWAGLVLWVIGILFLVLHRRRNGRSKTGGVRPVFIRDGKTFTCPSCGHTESARSEVIRFLTQELRGGAGPPYQ